MKKESKTTREDTMLQSYFNQIKSIQLLTAEEEKELSKRIQKGDMQARQKLVESNLRLVVKIARGYLSADIAFMDIIQEGNVGLIHAAEKYDHHKDVRFSTYASWWIRQSISRYLSNKQRIIRLPNRKEETRRKIQKVYYLLNQELMREPTTEEIAVELEMPVEKIELILNMSADLVSLDKETEAESSTVLDHHEDWTYNPEHYFMKASDREHIDQLLENLKEKERQVIRYRYQLNGDIEESFSLKRTGERMGISPETVRQIEIRALRKMRRCAEQNYSSRGAV
ncbi:hypothetical protein FACS1894172_13700 [Spirochaetia bacterium]|nr:hypothetical protein FACS1894164_15580 [Spirochaetia bacterium]GHU34017.1 hypothetical protein FACS1894172_13700 [Spirochaetia bacterium]